MATKVTTVTVIFILAKHCQLSLYLLTRGVSYVLVGMSYIVNFHNWQWVLFENT